MPGISKMILIAVVYFVTSKIDKFAEGRTVGMLMCEQEQNSVLNIVPCKPSTLNLLLAGTEHR